MVWVSRRAVATTRDLITSASEVTRAPSTEFILACARATTLFAGVALACLMPIFAMGSHYFE